LRLRAAVAAVVPALEGPVAAARAAGAAARAAATVLVTQLVRGSVDIALALPAPPAAAAARDLCTAAAISAAATVAAAAAAAAGGGCGASDVGSGAGTEEAPVAGAVAGGGAALAIASDAARALLHAATGTDAVLRVLYATFHLLRGVEAAEATATAAAEAGAGWEGAGWAAAHGAASDHDSEGESSAGDDIESGAVSGFDLAWNLGGLSLPPSTSSSGANASADGTGTSPGRNGATVGPATAALLVAASAHLQTRGTEPARVLASSLLAPSPVPGLPFALLAPPAATARLRPSSPAPVRSAAVAWLARAAAGALTGRDRAALSQCPRPRPVVPNAADADADAEADAEADEAAGQEEEAWYAPDSDGEDDAGGPAPQAQWVPLALQALPHQQQLQLQKQEGHQKRQARSRRRARRGRGKPARAGTSALALLLAAAGSPAAVLGEAALLALQGVLVGGDAEGTAAEATLELLHRKEPHIVALEVR
jgi:hypothetical protein